MSYSSIMEKLKGINAINVTPFKPDGEIDWSSLERNINFLMAENMTTLYPCGNTGEFYSLSPAEAAKVTQFVRQRAGSAATVIAGIGYQIETAVQLVRQAEEAGVDGLMLHQPIHPFIHPQGVIDYYQVICGQTTLPVVLYIKNDNLPVETIKKAVSISNVVAVKYAVNHLPSFASCVQQIAEEIVWICGTAEKWAPFFFAAGAVGFTSGMVNVATERSVRLLEAMREGRFTEAMTLWQHMLPFEELRARHHDANNVAVVKEAMFQLGRISHYGVRPPAAPLSEAEKKECAHILKAWGLQSNQDE